jgi:hypothetical protein
MTVLVGIANGANVYIGADRGASDENVIVSMSRPKVHVNGKWIYAYSGSIGTGQLLEFIKFPDPSTDDVYKLIRLNIVANLKTLIEKSGKTDDDQGSEFLIGASGRLFEFSTADWGVTEVYETAGGSGNQIALGSLYTSLLSTIDIEERIELALNAAITYSPSCQGPYDILSV